MLFIQFRTYYTKSSVLDSSDTGTKKLPPIRVFGLETCEYFESVGRV